MFLDGDVCNLKYFLTYNLKFITFTKVVPNFKKIKVFRVKPEGLGKFLHP